MALAIILGLLAHFIGDYILQNDRLAHRKTKELSYAIIHGLIYGLPFILLVGVSWQLLVIIVSHIIIDRYRLAIYWIKLINWNWRSRNFGFHNDKPKWMSTWLMIIIDNIFHILINTAAIIHYLIY